MRTREVVHELKHHCPFTGIATGVGVIVAVCLIISNINVTEIYFETLHISHVFVSAIVTAAMFYKYEKRIIKSICVAISVAIIIGSISDIMFPFLGALFLNLEPHFHLPIIEAPLIVLGSSLLGAMIGVKTGFTKMPHFMHVLISVFASVFYLLAFTPVMLIPDLIGAFVIVFVAVVIPCCMSDIIFPFIFLGEKIKHCNCHSK